MSVCGTALRPRSLSACSLRERRRSSHPPKAKGREPHGMMFVFVGLDYHKPNYSMIPLARSKSAPAGDFLASGTYVRARLVFPQFLITIFVFRDRTRAPTMFYSLWCSHPLPRMTRSARIAQGKALPLTRGWRGENLIS